MTPPDRIVHSSWHCVASLFPALKNSSFRQTKADSQLRWFGLTSKMFTPVSPTPPSSPTYTTQCTGQSASLTLSTPHSSTTRNWVLISSVFSTSNWFCSLQFLAALAALYPPLWFIHSWSWIQLQNFDQTIPTTSTTYFSDPPELLSHLTYPPTWPTHPSVLPTHLILNPSNRITSQNPKITSLNPQITSLNLHAASEFWLNHTRPYQTIPNLTSPTKFHNFDKISQIQPNFTILVKFHTFYHFFYKIHQISQFQRNITILR